MALDSPSLQAVLNDVASGKIQLPDFQREWKWDDERIRALLATVTLDYPLGVVMTLATGGEAQFKARPLAGTQVGSNQVPEQLLLDGQQRLTSLYQALRADQPVATVDARGRKLQRWYYIDVAASVSPGTDREDTIISVPADRVLREDFARKVKLDLSSPELESAAGFFPLNLALDIRRKSAWHQRYVQADPARWEIWSHFEERVLNRIIAFQVPFIRLPHETPKDAVCSVFERVNTGGVVLNVFELLTATYAGDRGYARANGADFSLAEHWRVAKARLAAAYPVLGAVENGQETGLTSIDFLQAISLVSTYEKKRESSDGSGHAVGCKRRDLLRLPLADFLHWAPVVESAFDWVGAFLTRQCVFRTEDLPYRTQLVPLAAIRAILGDRTDLFEAEIARWYWCGVLGELYGGATESRFPRDVEQVVAWLSDADLPDTVVEATFQERRLETLASRNSAAYKGIYALLIKQGAVDWYFTEGPITREILVGQYVDIRQVFPKNWFERQGGKTPTWATSIVNKTPLSYRASRGISGAPSAYLKDLARESGTPDDWFDDLLGTHLIDAKTLRADDADAFWAARVERLLKLIAETMGKSPVRLDGDRGAGEE